MYSYKVFYSFTKLLHVFLKNLKSTRLRGRDTLDFPAKPIQKTRKKYFIHKLQTFFFYVVLMTEKGMN